MENLYNKERAIKRMEERFETLLKLDYDWDSYGAEPLDRVTVTRARAVADLLIEIGCPPPQLVPTVEKGVSLEWWNPEYEFSIEFAPNEYEVIYFKDDTFEWEGPIDEPKAARAFKEGLQAIANHYNESELPSITSLQEMLTEL